MMTPASLVIVVVTLLAQLNVASGHFSFVDMK